jgi:hypothetical protein
VELHKGKLTARNAGPGLMVMIELPVAVEQGAKEQVKQAVGTEV